MFPQSFGGDRKPGWSLEARCVSLAFFQNPRAGHARSVFTKFQMPFTL